VFAARSVGVSASSAYRKPPGERVVGPERIASEGAAFFDALLSELKLREPAIPFAPAHLPTIRNQINE
jgi:hypothetical protein